jgi:hypothetical protein
MGLWLERGYLKERRMVLFSGSAKEVEMTKA